MKFQRRSLFYVLTLMFPSCSLYMLSGLILILPVESGEKVSFAVTLLLAQFVTFGTLTAIFPASSLHFPILAYFVSAVAIHMSILCCIAILGRFITEL